MKCHRAYKFRIYPDQYQKIQLSQMFGCVRFVYNHFLARKTVLYQEEKKSLNYNACAKELVALKQEAPFLKEADSIALQQSLRHLDTAFQNFFRNPKVGFPRFKSKKRNRDSYTTVCVKHNIRLEQGRLLLPKIKWIRVKKHREIPTPYLLKSVTVSRTATGKYYASLLYEYETEISVRTDIREEKVLGLDFSMRDLFVASDGMIKAEETALHCYKKSQKRLAREQRRLSRCEKGSRRYEKQRRKVARIHEKTAFQRKDFLHKKSRQIANAFDAVCVEDLDMKGMAGALHFGKSVHDNGWGMFLSYLSYKLEEQGKKLIRVDRFFPSSKQCHICGHKKEVLELSERNWKCPECGTVHDRDYNASMNIKKEGMRLLIQRD